jgi:LAGLIDADG DNA endonuclease family
VTGERAGVLTTGLEFYTRALPCISELHSIFYFNGVKIIPLNIYELLTPVALAHLIMGDGSTRDYGLNICTDCFTITDVVRLMNVLIIRYGLNCTLQRKRDNQYRIYITSGSMPLLRSIVSPYMHSSMMYKINKS